MDKNSEYEKMPKHLKDVDERTLKELDKVKWVVTEKIHGANFSFVYEGNNLKFAKRKDYLNWSDDFFGFQQVVADIESKVIRLFEQLRRVVKANRYIIYGELFGGSYPHKDVDIDSRVQAIQTGVYYCPTIAFCAFDIAYEVGEQKYYLDYKKAIVFFDEVELLYARPLFIGKLNEALQFSIRINSQLPSQLKLPALSSNLIEGVVVKPMTHHELSDPTRRPIVKIKNPEFDEEEKFHEASKWSFIPDVVSRSEELSFIVEDMVRYITQNRFNSVVSKTGKLDASNEIRMKEIEQEFLSDVLLDFSINNKGLLDDLSELDRLWITDRMRVYMKEFIEVRLREPK